MKNVIKLIAIAILIGSSFLAVNAQESTIISVNETSTATEKVEKKKESAKKRQSADDDSWTGFYVGGFGGYSNIRATPLMTTPNDDIGNFILQNAQKVNNTPNPKLNTHSFNGGGTFGFNHQKGQFVVGAEVDFGANRINSSANAKGNYSDGGNFTITHKVKADWLLTARPRIGFATEKVLVYGTGGLSLTNLQHDGNFETFVLFTRTADGSLKKIKAGWNAGGGVEVKVNKRWSVKGEYLYNQFGRESFTINNLRFISPSTGNVNVTDNEFFTYSTDLKSHSIRFGINYRF